MNDFLTNYFKNPKDKEDFWIALVVIALFMGSIIYSIFPFGEDSTSISFFEESRDNAAANVVDMEETAPAEFSALVAQKEDKAITEKVMADQALVEKLDNWIDTTETEVVPEETWEKRIQNFIDKTDKTDKVDFVEAETTAENEDTSTAVPDTVIAETIEDAIVTEDTPDVTTDNTSTSTAESTDNNTETNTSTTSTNNNTDNSTNTDTNTSASTTTTEETTPKPVVPKKDKPTVASPKCVIIVGAFAKRHNADKVIKQLEKAKYKVHTFYRKGRLAVSVTDDCKDEKGLQAKLNALKKQYKGAWILR